MQDNQTRLIGVLQSHRVKTLRDIRHIERILMQNTTPEAIEAMADAWTYYVQSNNLLSELRGQTKNYPFSSECLDEAKTLVLEDPNRARSWNPCWLVLTKIAESNLIAKHAHDLASRPAMWGIITPLEANVQQLERACMEEWTSAVQRMLRHWEVPPLQEAQ
ncbi:hypothetical protein ASPZODRAFT_19153 [Penicilliopsis zonata CBS 506.65]|uniref:Uncharacterized protein n=1 Tax=Penicilliopsis zonata CBS 506.65 TaxID=1073090 RepID=A0A1L9S9K6_9EURO|nr:hypothetical protein ASPZODRAFT_19153 [Penicilliopsis zonata CBS 506.65]OJJ43851.1 hypothetical protein ASPZODRAFT_19153 [Penicilliopsis zonata CBS 506.65]